MFSNFLLAAALSFDALGIGIAYSLKGVKIPIIAKGIILIISYAFASIAIYMGHNLINIFPAIYAKLLGIIILLGIGIYTALGDPFTYDVDKSLKIDPREALLMGFALSVDSLGVGIGSAVAGFSCKELPAAISLCQFLFLCFGQLIGSRLLKHNKVKGRFWTVLAGVIIIIIAILRVI